ncbi:hypothetical protein PMIN06_004923 [Paraphaeosphaeria minitans]|uniref:Extracellular dioxygenase n=1 Tax=Paraphaeosphaeria minitans TaxID=565426 RepID=A0A9P6KKR8_9PLEO|nr:putative extracellular dioxygenase [Paraphaeosphaeria minitans]
MQLLWILGSALVVETTYDHPGHGNEKELHARRFWGTYEGDRTSRGIGLHPKPLTIFKGGRIFHLPRISRPGYKVDTDRKEILSARSPLYLHPKLPKAHSGIPLHWDIHLVELNDCQPAKDVFLELRSANSTGVYSGAMNGLHGATDTFNLNTSFRCELQVPSADGVAQFKATFPGDCDGRATHCTSCRTSMPRPSQRNRLGPDSYARGAAILQPGPHYRLRKDGSVHCIRQRLASNGVDGTLLQEMAMSDPFLEIMAVALNYKDGDKVATDNPKVPGLSVIIPDEFSTDYQLGYGSPKATKTLRTDENHE